MPLQTAQEQLLLELINRARLDPAGEAARYGIDLNQGLTAGTISATAKQVLAGNDLLSLAADTHSAWMISADSFSHTGSGGSSALQRMVTAGYTLTTPWSVGENIAWIGTTNPTIDVTQTILEQHQGLFLSASHRTNILNASYKEVGIGVETGAYTHTDSVTYTSSVMTTEDFAVSGTSTFLTGVAYNDTNNDDFYSVGEGRGGITITVGSQGTATTASPGGFEKSIAQGNSTVTFSGGGLTQAITVSVVFGTQNVKLDLIDGNTVAGSTDLTLGANAVGARLLGVANLYATGNDLANVIDGNSGDNILSAGAGNDTVTGGAGNDYLAGEGGNDSLAGGDGVDWLWAGWGDDTLDGGAGNDNLNGEDGNDSLQGGDGNDRLTGNTGNDTIRGGNGDDWIGVWNNYGTDPANNFFPEYGDDLIYGDAGNDVLSAGLGRDTVYGGIGNDYLAGEQDDDILYGEDGQDWLWGGTGNDTLDGGAEKDNLNGEAGDDLIYAGDGNDRITGRDGNDTIHAGNGNDWVGVWNDWGEDPSLNYFPEWGNDLIYGEGGNDVLSAGFGADTVDGGDGDDYVAGEQENDVLYGGAGTDWLWAGSGDDTLTGGDGADILIGESGADVFVFRAVSELGDRIVDFNGAEGDRIDVSALMDAVGYTGTTPFAVDRLHLTQSGADVLLSVDTTGASNFLSVATLENTSLSAIDPVTHFLV